MDTDEDDQRGRSKRAKPCNNVWFCYYPRHK